MDSPEMARTRLESAQKSLAPGISLPKGGGAIRGIGEKFAANPVTGTGSMSVPIATSPGRAGFGPQLSLNYDSGAGNGSFGFGWSLALPQITRKTDKGLPQYHDAQDSDVFILSGAEDLVPVAVERNGTSVRETLPDRTIGPDTYTVQRYRPRIEGLFARIERWTRHGDGDVHWRSISRDNILTLYGKDEKSRIADPADPLCIFAWLICETRDDKGNAIVYDYKAEDGAGVDLGLAHERNRGDRDDARRAANRYPKRIRYGNRLTLLDAAGRRPPMLSDTQRQSAEWMFEVVFDYGEHDADVPKPSDAGAWRHRGDPFSSYRAGFEVRACRLCQRVLMFHHFMGEPGVGPDCLVRSTDFHYSQQPDAASARNPAYAFLLSVSQTGYKRHNGGYRKRSLPPVEYQYTQAVVQDTVHEVDAASLQNLPYGVDGTAYQWADLHGEGIPGILTEQGGAWFYKRNVSPISERPVEFAPLECVAAQPNLALAGGHAQFMDLAGDGQPDLVMLEGESSGLYEHDGEEGWQRFRPFTARLNRNTRDPNLKFIDLDGDGHADVLISEDDAFIWHASLAEEGFGPARRVHQALDEEKGPRLVFADGTESIYLADLAGDGLTDLVRIRNGDVCYWPNLGYARFGPKVTMDNAPHFDDADHFDHKRIRVADIDGTGTSDLIYLHRDGVRLYFNLSGNSWSEARQLKVFPRVNDLASITPTDLFGNGTACLVWSSPLPGDAHGPMRYVDLMGGQKPHLLVKSVNNLGAETTVSYAPSTKFYLADKAAGKPWITKLPFPVHCVEKVTVAEEWRKTAFSTTYSYHHGYFDGAEREFRGFGRVEQVDVESYGEFAAGNAASPYISDDKTLYQPPVKTVTWYHTGAMTERERVLSQFAHEYFSVPGEFQENVLPDPDLSAQDLGGEEWREALRACKGMMLRQETYELDVDALERGEHVAVKLFSSAYHNCHIRRLQPKAENRHAVFLVAESEAITYHYELDLRAQSLRPDPRIAHTLNLRFDEFSNVLQSAAVVYPRRGRFEDDALPPDAVALIRSVQQERHVAYSETRYTNDVAEPDDYRLRVPSEVLTYDLTGVASQGDYFAIDELRGLRLSLVHQATGTPVPEIPYHQLADGTSAQKRLVEHARTLFFDDAPAVPSAALSLGQLGRLGLPFETYKLALTNDLLSTVFGNKLTSDVLARLDDATTSGYLKSANDGQYWIRSGIAGFAADAAQHFYLPERFTDAFGHSTTIDYDARDLMVASTTDALGNTTGVQRFDFRVLAPAEMRDINGNLSEVFFDVLGLPAAMVVKGKGNEGDTLAGFDDELANPDAPTLATFFEQVDLDETRARAWLAGASARYVYYLGETVDSNGVITWGVHPACACGIARETHVSELAAGEQSALQTTFDYSDGVGRVLLKKVQAEPEAPGQALRWVASGKTILNNKGQPVKQYEPYFSASGHRFEEPMEIGVTSVIYYDAAGRAVRTELPDGTFSRIEFSPWFARTFDPNDTVLESKWYVDRNPPDPAQPLPRDIATGLLLVTQDQRAAWLAAQHAGTPALTVLDSLGRDVIAIAHNRIQDPTRDEYLLTFTKLDAEGKPLWVRDARGNRVMQYITPPVPDNQSADPLSGFAPCYDLAGNLLIQHSMDAGDRWMLNDAAGKPMLGWNSRGHAFRTEYDALHRPVSSFVAGTDPQDPGREIQFEKVIYGDTPNNGLSASQRSALNICGQTLQHRDTAGIVTSMGRNPNTGDDEAFDFKGNPIRSTRRLVKDYKVTPDWLGTPDLEAETFSSATQFDALNRPVQIVAPHGDRPGTRLNVIRPGFNEAGLLERVDVWLEQASEPAALLDPAMATQHAVTNIDYDAKGQRTGIRYGNGVGTRYEYDPLTFRLKHLVTERGNAFADGGAIQDLSYFYDPVGNITAIRDDAQQTIFFSGQRVEPSADYEYDAIYRLITATGREHVGQHASPQVDHDDSPRVNQLLPTNATALRNYTERYQYDQVGNILQLIHEAGTLGSWTRAYDHEADSNRLRATSLPGDGEGVFSASYQHDAHGNMTRMPHLPLMQWDLRDQLQASSRQVVTTGSPETTWYVYDAGGQRVRKVTDRQAAAGETPARMKERIYLGGFEVYREYANDGEQVTLERETLRLMDDKQRIALVETKTIDGAVPVTTRAPLVRYQLGNHLGSASLELDDAGRIVSYEEYHPYGSTSYQAGRNAAEVSLKRYRYTGMERDEESGLAYHSARYYMPWLGRWTSADPLFISAGVNMFCYARNHPTTLTDRNGKQPQKPTAQFGDINPHHEQGKARWDASVRISEHEHIRARINLWLETFDAQTSSSPYDKAAYRRSSTLTIPKDMANIKTRMDLNLRDRIRAAQQSGVIDTALVREMEVEADIERTIRARDQAIAARRQAGQSIADFQNITNESIQRTAHYQQGELFDVGKAQRSPIAGATAAEADAALSSLNHTPEAVGPQKSTTPKPTVAPTEPALAPKSSPSGPVPFKGGGPGTVFLDPAPKPTVGNAALVILATVGPDLAEAGAKKLGASEKVQKATGFFASVGVGALIGGAAGLPEGGVGAIPGAVIGGVIGGVGYLSRNYELCVPFYSCD
jgi:RHS repeat-associated protein